MRLALAAVAALAALAAACGGVEREANLRTASERTAATGSYRADIGVVGTDDVSRGRVDVHCEAAFDLEKARAQYTCDPDKALEWIFVDGEQYSRVPGGGWTVTSDSGPFVSEHVSPEGFLLMLRRASSETERVGEEDVRGAATVGYRLAVRCEEAGLSCPRGETGTVDVWIDDDGLVRRVQLEERGVTSTVEYFDFGMSLDIEPPPAEQVTRAPPRQADPEPCVSGEERPIRVRQAVDVLGDHGFEMKNGDFGCGPGIAGAISSGFEPVHLSCYVLTSPGSVTIAEVTLPSGAQIREERELANLQCTVYFERESVEAVERLDAALAELKQAVRP